jgi:hypothetical protein
MCQKLEPFFWGRDNFAGGMIYRRSGKRGENSFKDSSKH